MSAADYEEESERQARAFHEQLDRSNFEREEWKLMAMCDLSQRQRKRRTEELATKGLVLFHVLSWSSILYMCMTSNNPGQNVLKL